AVNTSEAVAAASPASAGATETANAAADDEDVAFTSGGEVLTEGVGERVRLAEHVGERAGYTDGGVHGHAELGGVEVVDHRTVVVGEDGVLDFGVFLSE